MTRPGSTRGAVALAHMLRPGELRSRDRATARRRRKRV